jgi:antitoxin component YwqK of YwqJK toxin-antitoxin module
LWAKVTYAAGKLDGPAEVYYDNGQLQQKETYKADALDGPYESYHENGQLGWKGF